MSNDKDLSGELEKLFDSDDGELFKPKEKVSAPTADDRLAESFNEITRFVEKNDSMPDAEADELTEAGLARRLESIKNTPWKVEALEKYDSLGLLEAPKPPESIEELFSNEEYGLLNKSGEEILNVSSVLAKSRAESDKIATRKRAMDFSKFNKGFKDVQEELKKGDKKLVKFTNVEQLKKHRYYVGGGLLLYVDEIGEEKNVHGRMKSRLRAIFENGTESDMFLRSLSSQLYYDGYCVVSKDEIIDDSEEVKENIKGYIYVVKSLSDDPKISSVKDLYKIGFSTAPVKSRVANAKIDPTYLMADVEFVEVYKITGDYNPQKVEHFIHRVFADAALDVSMIKRDGRDYRPKEWYCVPIEAIRHAISLIDSGDITDYVYDSETETMKEVK